MSDNQTTELLKDYAFALRRLEYDADKPGSNMTLGEYEAEEKKVTDEYSQAIAATLGNSRAEHTCKFTIEDNMNETEGMGDVWIECSACHCVFDFYADEWLMKMSYCPNCGCKVVVE